HDRLGRLQVAQLGHACSRQHAAEGRGRDAHAAGNARLQQPTLAQLDDEQGLARVDSPGRACWLGRGIGQGGSPPAKYRPSSFLAVGAVTPCEAAALTASKPSKVICLTISTRRAKVSRACLWVFIRLGALGGLGVWRLPVSQTQSG
ncbi:unnamed protein product, partial [Brugia timori]|uniref:Integron gene cassette protein n=1 Tax=Brugia timori TaxID=42155 RepID=A0A0R3Q560_9BILA